MDPMNTDLMQALLRVDVAEAFSPPAEGDGGGEEVRIGGGGGDGLVDRLGLYTRTRQTAGQAVCRGAHASIAHWKPAMHHVQHAAEDDAMEPPKTE